MSGRRLSNFFTIAAVVGFGLICSTARAEDLILRYLGTTEGTANGQKVTRVRLASLERGEVAVVTIPNDESKIKGKEPEPRKELMDAIKKLSEKDIVKADIAMGSLGATLTSIEP